ncbi:hypothetical protein ACTXT7_001014 [Hymenolepis weldensis]
MEHKSVRRSSKNAPDKELLITSRTTAFPMLGGKSSAVIKEVFTVSDLVFGRDFRIGHPWMAETVVKRREKELNRIGPEKELHNNNYAAQKEFVESPEDFR